MIDNRQDGFYHALIEYALRNRQSMIHTNNFRYNDDLFTKNGIVQKIISAPAEDALRAGFLLQGVEDEEQENLFSVLEDLEASKSFANALSWDRLHGGAAILMVIDDGGNLNAPVNENKIRKIEKLEIYSPEDIMPLTFYSDTSSKKFGEAEIFSLVNYYGNSFEVHETRLLMFRGGLISNVRRRERNGFGGTVIEQISDDLAHYAESLRLSIAALEKLSQDIMKLDGMTALMQNDFGEQQVQKRLQLIDLYRRLENVIALDSKDEFERKNLSLGGVKDIIEQAEYALSASTGIPATILFGRSPAGMSATGESDFENYYNMVGRIQERTLRPNLTRLIYLLNIAAEYDLKLPESYSIEFKPLWLPSEKEKAETEKLLAETQSVKASTLKILHELGAMDAMEIRNEIAEEYELDRTLDKILTEPAEKPEGEEE